MSESKNRMPISLCYSSFELFLICCILLTKSLNVASSLSIWRYIRAYVLDVSIHKGFMSMILENSYLIVITLPATLYATPNAVSTLKSSLERSVQKVWQSELRSSRFFSKSNLNFSYLRRLWMSIESGLSVDFFISSYIWVLRWYMKTLSLNSLLEFEFSS